MTKGWMIRAGQGGRFIDSFRDQHCVAVGWNDLGELSQYKSTDEIRAAYIQTYGDAKPARTSNAVAMIRKFRDEITKGNLVISYDPELRKYLVGTDLGEYVYRNDESLIGEYANARRVKWTGEVSRDQLSQSVRNSLGSTLTLFALTPSVIDELLAVLEGKAPASAESDEVDEVIVPQAEQAVNNSHELIKDKIQAVSPEDMEHLVAAVLRAMGYRTRALLPLVKVYWPAE